MRFLSLDDLRDRGITFARVHLARLEASGRFPKHVLLGENRIAWVEEEFDAWVAERLAERDNPPSRRPRGRHTKKQISAAMG
jgi:prophage regulatory protein